LADAYATIKVLVSQQGREQVGVVVNQVHRAGEGRKICQQLQGVLSRFVPQAFRTPDQAELLHLVGELPHDEAVREAVQSRQLLLVVQPGCPASLALMKLARHLEARWSATATPVRQNS
jgi:flagellar biosynthesis protein FlhG